MVLGIPGTDNILPGFNLSGMLSGVGQFILLVFLFLVVGGIFYTVYYLKKKKKDYNKKNIFGSKKLTVSRYR